MGQGRTGLGWRKYLERLGPYHSIPAIANAELAVDVRGVLLAVIVETSRCCAVSLLRGRSIRSPVAGGRCSFVRRMADARIGVRADSTTGCVNAKYRCYCQR
jgi:hypothetical protein